MKSKLSPLGMKDNFSQDAEAYVKFRPHYPRSLYETLLSLVTGRSRAWDCGTGNGQVAAALADHFTDVVATDISKTQILHAAKKPNIAYRLEAAERSSSADSHFDLITVAQALHWFDTGRFFAEVHRTLRPGGLFAAFGYVLCTVDPPIDALIHRLYMEILGDYWDDERRIVDSQYGGISFPYALLAVPPLSMEYEWKRDHFIGYLNTWSAVRHYKNRTGNSPIDIVTPDLNKIWRENERKNVTFPMFLKAGRKVGS